MDGYQASNLVCGSSNLSGGTMTTKKKTEQRTTTTVEANVGTGYIHLVYNEKKNTIRGRFVGKPKKLGDLRKAFRDAVDELGL